MREQILGTLEDLLPGSRLCTHEIRLPLKPGEFLVELTEPLLKGSIEPAKGLSRDFVYHECLIHLVHLLGDPGPVGLEARQGLLALAQLPVELVDVGGDLVG